MELKHRKIAKQKILDSLDEFNIHGLYRAIVLEALVEWDWYLECDGCTYVHEKWVGDYFPPCLVHDYLRHTNHNALSTDLIFRDLIYKYTGSKMKSFLYFIGVRLTYLILKR